MTRPNILLHDLREGRRGLIGWSIGIVATVGVMGAFWPSMRDMADIAQFLEAYPEEMRELFNIDAMTSGSGFLNVELFSIMLPIIFIVFGITGGARLLGGEEETGTMEVLASVGVSRSRILAEKLGVLVLGVGTLWVVTAVSTVLTSALFDMGVPTGEAVASSLAMALLGLEFGAIALAAAALTGTRGRSAAIGSVLAVGAYLFYIAGAFVDWLDDWRILSPFEQAIGEGPLGYGLRWPLLALVAVAVAAVAIALPVFDRRDVGT
jgi:ABC-2 type transport system permease protein